MGPIPVCIAPSEGVGIIGYTCVQLLVLIEHNRYLIVALEAGLGTYRLFYSIEIGSYCC